MAGKFVVKIFFAIIVSSYVLYGLLQLWHGNTTSADANIDFVKEIKSNVDNEVGKVVVRELATGVDKEKDSEVVKVIKSDVDEVNKSDVAKEIATDVDKEKDSDVDKEIDSGVAKVNKSDDDKEIDNGVIKVNNTYFVKVKKSDVAKEIATDVAKEIATDVAKEIATDVDKEIATDVDKEIDSGVAKVNKSDDDKEIDNGVIKVNNTDVVKVNKSDDDKEIDNGVIKVNNTDVVKVNKSDDDKVNNNGVVKVKKSDVEDVNIEMSKEDKSKADVQPNDNLKQKQPNDNLKQKQPNDNLKQKQPNDNLKQKQPNDNLKQKQPNDNLKQKQPNDNLKEQQPNDNLKEKQPNDNLKQKQPNDNLKQKQPNVLIFFVDDWGYGDLGVNCNETISNTPYMDKFAKEGIRFNDFHVGSSICTPSRASLLTGRIGLRTGVTMMFGPDNVAGLPLNETLMSNYFKAANYTTFAIGKWHLGHHDKYHPLERGFDHYYGVPYSLDQGCLDYAGYIHPSRLDCKHETSWYFDGLPLYQDKKIIEQPLNVRELSQNYVDEFKKRITDAKVRRANFFGYIPFSHVHVPLAYNAKYENTTSSVFGDTLKELDTSFHDMLQVLKDNDLYDNTVIWLLGDNGPWESQCEYAGNPGPFKGLWQKEQGGGGSSWKATVWEGGHRVPSVVTWPKLIKKNRVSKALTSSLDILPTLGQLINFKLPSDRQFDGSDLSDLLFDKTDDIHQMLFHPRADGFDGDITAVRYKQYKAIYETGGRSYIQDCNLKPGPPKQHDPPLLFNLLDDPAERMPLNTSLPKYKELVERIRKLREQKLSDIFHDKRSVVDTKKDTSARPCCNRKNKKCRC